MTVKRVPFESWHLKWLEEDGQPAGGMAQLLDSALLTALEGTPAHTWVVEDKPICSGGFLQQWPGRTTCWMYMGGDTGPHMLALTRDVRQLIGEVIGRVELTVRCDFAAGHNWARMLGFDVETPVMKAYGPEGENHTGYVRYN